ncbi:MAG: hypothetical protein ABIS50_15745 [Luteolibacter sp.]|uniref:hypothetical protein n=1 Tax=Luteolibacter sp. TaxID=1962973 RepID=UPI003262D5CE
MKTIQICFFIFSTVVLSAGEEPEPFIFPPFDKADMTESVASFPDHDLSYEELNSVPVKDLRAIMTAGNPTDQFEAIRWLIQKNDLKTILRMVYALKQGNPWAEEVLRNNQSMSVVPYLIEDVAHGSLESYGSKSANPVDGSVRVAATGYVAATLAIAPEFSGPTKDFLKSLDSGRGILTLSDESKYLTLWWLLNQDAINAGKWNETKPLPGEIRLREPEFLDTKPLPGNVPPDPILLTPKFGPSWELSESFEAWAKRIVDPKLRNLNFVELTWDRGRLTEHPAKSLDPKLRQDRESRKDSVSRSKTTDGIAEKIKGIPWLAWWAALVVIVGLIKLRMRSKAK